MNTSNHKNKKRVEMRACKKCDFRFDIAKAKCPSCGLWDIPETLNDSTDQTILLSEVSHKPLSRIESGPWDKCFSQEGGIVTTSVTLIGGAPGAGKSTMSLQLSDRIAQVTKREIIYIGAEELPEEIKHRATRLELVRMDLIRVHPMGSSADLGAILLNRKPCAIILDSLPGLVSDPEMGVELCKRFKDYAVKLHAPVIVIDHITKDNDFAGLMALQHAVDTLLTMVKTDGEYRQLETIKNRFGPASVCLELLMTGKGLVLGIQDNEDIDE